MTWTGDDSRDWRARMGYSQADAARELDLNPRQLYRYEHDIAPVPGTVQLTCMFLLEQRSRLRAIVQRQDRRGGLRPPRSYDRRRKNAKAD